MLPYCLFACAFQCATVRSICAVEETDGPFA